MTGKVLEISQSVAREDMAASIANSWQSWQNARILKMAEWEELRDYLFATDTTKTSNSKLPWKNKTTVPKLTQIRDNLHANYLSSLFPNDEWMRWEGYTANDATIAKKKAIEAYLGNKTREGEFRQLVSQLVYDYIDYGNAFADVEYVHEKHIDPASGETIDGFVGPKIVRISPLDIVFNPVSSSFRDSPKIVRYVKSFGELKSELDTRPELGYNKDIITQVDQIRSYVPSWDAQDLQKAAGYSVDGFGTLWDYYTSGMVEILEFEGDVHDAVTGEFLKNHVITVVDRSHVIRKAPLASWTGRSNKQHVGWRKRPDNLWAMGPLDNLVGMQYRIDHLENIKADLFDLIAHPPLKIKGNVEEFEWGPMAEIFLGDDGEVEVLKVDATALQADTQIAVLEQRMEELAGAPKQAMGIRTPGEKTAYEVQSLENAAGRIFQEKVSTFEIEMIEPLLNVMLEVARRNLDMTDVIRVMDDDLGVVEFLSITKEDITAKGHIRPIGSRHFAARAMLVQNVNNFFNSSIGQDPSVKAHISGKAIAKMFEDLLGVEKYAIVSDNIRLMEEAETQKLLTQLQQEAMQVAGVDMTSTGDPATDQLLTGGVGGTQPPMV